MGDLALVAVIGVIIFLVYKAAKKSTQPIGSIGKGSDGADVYQAKGISVNLATKALTYKGRVYEADIIKGVSVEFGAHNIAMLAIATTDIVQPRIMVRVGDRHRAREIQQSLANIYDMT